MRRFSLCCVLLLAFGGPCVAGACDPIESAPGVKSLPDGCKPPRPVAGIKQDKPEVSEKTRPTKGHVVKFGDAEVHFGGKVIFEAGTGMRR